MGYVNSRNFFKLQVACRVLQQGCFKRWVINSEHEVGSFRYCDSIRCCNVFMQYMDLSSHYCKWLSKCSSFIVIKEITFCTSLPLLHLNLF
jgi:hypothetical protein